MLETLVVPGINRLLRTNAWALEKLKRHTGKTVSVNCAPLHSRVTVTPAGELAPADGEAVPDVTIYASPGLLARAAAGDDSAWSAVRADGDVEFAAALDYVRRNLRWDYEEDLSRVFGDIAAHRLAAGARELHRWGRDAAVNASRAFAEYALHENPMVASPPALTAFAREVDKLRDDAERLEKRLELIRRRLDR